MIDIDELAQKLVDRLSKPSFNGSIHFDSDTQGLPGHIIQQVVHTIRPHSKDVDWKVEMVNCPACRYRMLDEPLTG